MNSDFKKAGQNGELTYEIYFLGFTQRAAENMAMISHATPEGTKENPDGYEAAMKKVFETMSNQLSSVGLVDHVTHVVDYTDSPRSGEWGVLARCTKDAAEYFKGYFWSLFDDIRLAMDDEKKAMAFADEKDGCNSDGCCGGSCGDDEKKDNDSSDSDSNDDDSNDDDKPGCGGSDGCCGGCGGPTPGPK